MKKAFVLERLEEVLPFIETIKDDLLYSECDCGCGQSTLSLPPMPNYSIKELINTSNLWFVDDVRVNSVVFKEEGEDEIMDGYFCFDIILVNKIDDWDGECLQQVIFEEGNN